MTFCNDSDLLYWEPEVMREAAFASQTLVTGTGNLNNDVLSKTTGLSFTAQHVGPGNVVVFSGAATGCFAVTSLFGPADLFFTVLYADPFPDAGAPPTAVGLGTVAGVDFVIRTFYPQRKIVSDLLLAALGVVPGTSDAAATVVLNPQALRRACALGTLQMVYNALAAAATDPAKFTLRAELYERLYRRALRQAQVDLDLDGDGRADARRSPGLLRLVRE